jgi:hypothetical protein
MSALHLTTFRLKDAGKTMRNIKPFCIQKSMDGIAVKVKNASHVKKGTLLVEVQTIKQAEVLLKADLLGS